MKYMELIAPCHFGMEAVLKREILDLGYEISKVEDGKVTFLADAEGIAQANMFLRTTERILLKTGEFKAVTFDELFEKTKAIPWEEYIPKDGKFWVAKANSVKSALFSPSDIQSIMKKAIVERLKSVYGISWFQEDGASFPIAAKVCKYRHHESRAVCTVREACSAPYIWIANKLYCKIRDCLAIRHTLFFFSSCSLL